MSAQFITLDGIDGAGKTTCIKVLKAWFEAHHLPVLFTREPGGTALGEQVRAMLLDPATKLHLKAETLLLFAIRMQHVHEVILPALERGIHVVSDRFSDATFAYQGAGKGLPAEDIRMLETWVQQGFQPNLSFILDLPVTEARKRLQEGQEDRFERENSAFFERVRTGYLSRAAQFPHRCRVIRANESEVQVASAIQNALQTLFNGQTS